MAQFIVRHLEEDVKARLKLRAARHGRSMEEEVRHILRDAVKEENHGVVKLGSRIATRFAKAGLTADLPDWSGSDRCAGQAQRHPRVDLGSRHHGSSVGNLAVSESQAAVVPFGNRPRRGQLQEPLEPKQPNIASRRDFAFDMMQEAFPHLHAVSFTLRDLIFFFFLVILKEGRRDNAYRESERQRKV